MEIRIWKRISNNKGKKPGEIKVEHILHYLQKDTSQRMSKIGKSSMTIQLILKRLVVESVENFKLQLLTEKTLN